MPRIADLLVSSAPGLMDLLGLPAVTPPLPWQAEIWSRLNRQIGQGQLPHALLLAGAQYTGKSSLALALARLLLCHEPADGMNCGRCHACELSASGSHGDLRWLEPEEKSRVIKIDQVRSLVEFAGKTASYGQRKVIVLAPADCMNSNAANALLKSLEEPAPETYLILVCHRLRGLPATIRSRCQIRKLGLPANEQSLAWLDQVTGQRSQSEELLELAEGRPLLASAMFLQGNADLLVARRAALLGLLEGRVTVSAMAALLADAGVDEALAQLVQFLQLTLRQSSAGQLAGERGRGLFALLDELVSIQRAVEAGSNPNQQLLVEALLLKLQRIPALTAA